MTTIDSTQKKPFSVKKKAVLASSLAALMAIGGTFAFFTDRVDTQATATAGTVDLTLDANWADVSNFNPGDMADLSYSIENAGNKSIDVRERLVVHSSVAMDTADQAEFEIYKASDVEPDSNGAYKPKAGASPVATDADRIVSSDSKSITYNIDEYTLNGVGTAAETEAGITEASKDSAYVLVFKGGADNDFQDADVTVDLIAEAKQHRNTGDDTWDVISTETVTVGGQEISVVPGK